MWVTSDVDNSSSVGSSSRRTTLRQPTGVEMVRRRRQPPDDDHSDDIPPWPAHVWCQSVTSSRRLLDSSLPLVAHLLLTYSIRRHRCLYSRRITEPPIYSWASCRRRLLLTPCRSAPRRAELNVHHIGHEWHLTHPSGQSSHPLSPTHCLTALLSAVPRYCHEHLTTTHRRAT